MHLRRVIQPHTQRTHTPCTPNTPPRTNQRSMAHRIAAQSAERKHIANGRPTAFATRKNRSTERKANKDKRYRDAPATTLLHMADHESTGKRIPATPFQPINRCRQLGKLRQMACTPRNTQTPLYIYPRKGYTVDTNTLPDNVRLLDVETIDISSTQIRKLHSEHKDISTLLPKKVADILKNIKI